MFIASVVLWGVGAVNVLAPLSGAAARQFAAEVRAAYRLLHRLTHRNDRR